MVVASRQAELVAADLSRIVRGRVRVHELMSQHTTFHIGGPAEVFVVPAEVEDLVAVMRFADEKGLPVKLIGNGSNLLVGDGGLRGLVVRLAPNFSEVTWREDGVVVGAGARWPSSSRDASEAGLSGLESPSASPARWAERS